MLLHLLPPLHLVLPLHGQDKYQKTSSASMVTNTQSNLSGPSHFSLRGEAPVIG